MLLRLVFLFAIFSLLSLAKSAGVICSKCTYDSSAPENTTGNNADAKYCRDGMEPPKKQCTGTSCIAIKIRMGDNVTNVIRKCDKDPVTSVSACMTYHEDRKRSTTCRCNEDGCNDQAGQTTIRPPVALLTIALIHSALPFLFNLQH